MRKIKFFASLYKERSWLEEMAANGLLLTDISLGCIYYFERTEPCEKVFEIDRFEVSSHSSVSELNARNRALDLAAASGFTVLTHDADMNYYFIKDKVGDETDELYNTALLRQERAERFRKHHAFEAPIGLLVEWLIISVFCLLILALMLPILAQIDPAIPVIFGLIYIITTITEIGSAFYNITLGQVLYHELLLNHKEWELHKKYSVKKRFRRICHLSDFLQEQNDKGLTLTAYEHGRFLFEATTCRYDYYIDTRACLKSRLASQSRSLAASDLKWYEISITEAAEYQLQPIGILRQNAIIYKRIRSDQPLPAENANRLLYQHAPSLLGVLLIAGALFLGLFFGISAFHMGL